MKSEGRSSTFKLLLLLCAHPLLSSEFPWPQWRGPSRDGMIKQGAPWPISIEKDKLVLSWRKKIAKGYPSPVVSEKLVFTVETKGKHEIVRSFDRANGKQKWETRWKGSMTVPFFAWKNGSWVRSTPILDGENLFVGGMRDLLVCLDAETGKRKWSVDFMKRYGSPLPTFGFVSSPLIVGNYLFVQAATGLVKIDKRTGESIWRILKVEGDRYTSAFSSPMVAIFEGIEQLVVQTRTNLVGVNPTSGKVLWRKPVKAYRGMNILTPTILLNSIFTSCYGGKSLLFNLENNSGDFLIREKWNNKQEAYMSSPVIIGNYGYLHLRKQRMTCLDMRNGETKWISSETFGKYMSMVSDGKEILALDEDGSLYRIEANPEKLVILEKRKISQSPSWAYPALAGNQMFIRELEAIACYHW